MKANFYPLKLRASFDKGFVLSLYNGINVLVNNSSMFASVTLKISLNKIEKNLKFISS